MERVLHHRINWAHCWIFNALMRGSVLSLKSALICCGTEIISYRFKRPPHTKRNCAAYVATIVSKPTQWLFPAIRTISLYQLFEMNFSSAILTQQTLYSPFFPHQITFIETIWHPDVVLTIRTMRCFDLQILGKLVASKHALESMRIWQKRQFVG